MNRIESFLEAIGTIDPDEIAEQLLAVSALLDKAITVASMCAAVTETKADDRLVKVLKAFHVSLVPLVDHVAEAIADLDGD